MVVKNTCSRWKMHKYEFEDYRPSLLAQTIKSLPASGGDTGSVPGSRRSPGGRHGYPLQYSYLENLMHRGAWWATVHGVAKSRT